MIIKINPRVLIVVTLIALAVIGVYMGTAALVHSLENVVMQNAVTGP